MSLFVRSFFAFSIALALCACADSDQHDLAGDQMSSLDGVGSGPGPGPGGGTPNPPNPDSCPDPPGSSGYCGPDCICDEGEGDCDDDSDCAPGLLCHNNMGHYFGFGADVDVCLPECSRIGAGDTGFCSAECPCDAGLGDCDGDGSDECAAGLTCVHNIGSMFGFDPDVDVCLDACDPILNGTADYCSPACPCDEGQGDCDSDTDCASGYMCGIGAGPDYGLGSDVDVCVPVPSTPGSINWGDCENPSEKSFCEIDLSSGQVTCTGDNPTTLTSTSQGWVYQLDMTNWNTVAMVADLSEPIDWTINLGNSRTNNGWGGDGSTTSNDSEMQLRHKRMEVFQSDMGGSGQVLDFPNALEPVDTTVTVVCDGYISWTSSTGSTSLASDYIFQIDGNEPDSQNGTGVNDQNLWLGLDRTVGSSGRNGDGVESVTLTFAR